MSSLLPSQNHSPSSSSACQLEQSSSSSKGQCFRSSALGLFGCVDITSLVNFKPNIFCSLGTPTSLTFQSCQEKDEDPIHDRDFSNDQGTRYLRSKKTNNKGNKNENEDGLTTIGMDGRLLEEESSAPDQLSAYYYGARSNDRGLDSFVAEDCTTSQASCLIVETYACFPTDLELGQDEKTFVLTLSASTGIAVNGRGGEPQQLFTLEVNVKRDDDPFHSCRAAETACLDEHP